MDRKLQIDFENALIDHTWGKITLVQPIDEKELVISHAMEQIREKDKSGKFSEVFAFLGYPGKLREFISDFLSYGVIEDLLCDYHVEDIIINSTSIIFIHHTAVYTPINSLNQTT